MNRIIRRMHRYVIFVAVVFSALLSGCSPANLSLAPVLKEDTVLKDVISCFEESFASFDLGSPSYELVSHSRNSDSTTDLADYKVTAENDVMKLDCTIFVYYSLKDGAWVFDTSQVMDWSYKVISSTVTETDAETAFCEDAFLDRGITYADWSLNSTGIDLDAGTTSFSFSAVREDGFMSAVDRIYVVYSFAPQTKWELSYIDVEEGDPSWNIEGEWTYHNSDADMKLVIHQITDREVKFECDFDYSYLTGNPYNWMRSAQYATSRVETRSLYKENDGSTSFVLFSLGDASQRIYFSKEYGVIYMPGYMGRKNFFVFEHESDGYARAAENGAWPDVINILDNSPFKALGEAINRGDMKAVDYGGMTHYNVFSPYANADDDIIPTFDIYSQYNYLSGTIFLGHDVETGDAAPFRVYGDGVLLYEYNASKFTDTNYVEQFTVNISGVRELGIEVSDIMTNWYVRGHNINVCEILLSKEPLFHGYDYYSADGNEPYAWLQDDATLYQGLSYFKSVTGIQPYIALVGFDADMFELNSNFDYVLSSAKAQQYCQDLCDKLGFDSTGKYVILAYFSEEKDSESKRNGGYYLYWTAGAGEIMDGNVELFWDCLFDYPYSTVAKQFSNGFALFADRV